MSGVVEYGIDLGTTNSCIARWEEGKVRIFQNNDQMNVTPSAVHVLKTGRVIVGRRAHSALLVDPENVAVEFKRWIGQRDPKTFPGARRELSAEELSAEVLKSLKEDVRRQTGSDLSAAVITVPAAFGALQCEATARAAALAGLSQATLLQEPIAAAVGYGVRIDAKNQRWLVFDLGGGTLDVAVVSTRGGRLNVLEHRGDNLLGGKDIDRAIVDRVLLPALRANYAFDDALPVQARAPLLSRLRRKAEEAKIDLSRDDHVTLSLFDVGSDDRGVPIEIEVPLARSELEALIEPLVEKACTFALEALSSARLSGADLDRVLLVGGPTQMPLLRQMLKARIGAPIDFSADPMTVVGCGAAIHASTLERTPSPKFAEPAAPGANEGCVRLKLAHEAVSAELQSIVAGRIQAGDAGTEIKLETENGLWTSGWIKPQSGCFEATVALKAGDVTVVWVYARDASGRLVDTDAKELRIRHGLTLSAPPLPCALAVEVLGPHGKPVLDPIFPKGTPLPAEKLVKYRATHALVPGKSGSDLAIKLWEGDFLLDPEANHWVGNVLLPHDGIQRSVPEGAEIEITVRISASRAITVEAFVPHINQHFGGKLYAAEREQQSFSNLSQEVSAQVESYRERLQALERQAGDASLQAEIASLRTAANELDAKSNATKHAGALEPDDARRVVEESKNLRGRLGELELAAGERAGANKHTDFSRLVGLAEEVVTKFGGSLEKQQLTLLRRELERVAERGDERAIQRVCEEIEGLRWHVLSKHDWFWREIFDALSKPGVPFVDAIEAQQLLEKGHTARRRGDGESLREVVRALWNLQPKGSTDAASERAMRSGLRRY